MDKNFIDNFHKIKGARGIGGSASKDFFMVSTDFMPELIEDIKSGNSCYVVGASKLIKNGLIPSKIQCLVKESRGGVLDFMQVPNYTHNEAFGSRLANELRVPTVFAKEVLIDGRYHAIIADFRESGDIVHNFTDFAETDIDYPIDINAWDKLIRDTLNKKYAHFEKSKRDKLIMNFLRDFSKIYYFKCPLTDDKDFKPKNVVVIERNGQYFLGPSFDNELNFNALYTSSTMPNLEDTKKYLDYMNNNFPDTLNELLLNTQKALVNLDEISQNSVNDVDYRIRLKNYCEPRFNNLLSIAKNFLNSRVM